MDLCQVFQLLVLNILSPFSCSQLWACTEKQPNVGIRMRTVVLCQGTIWV